jgi:4-carboxymuconolactone decarboxylase
MSDEDLTTPGHAGGPARRRRAQGAKADQLQALLCSLDPELGEWADGFIFGDVWGRPGLSQDERMLVAMTALACGKNPDQLRNYIWGALQAGIPIVKIRESFTMLVVYSGFPVALQALALLKEIEAAAGKAAAGKAAVDIVEGAP